MGLGLYPYFLKGIWVPSPQSTSMLTPLNLMSSDVSHLFEKPELISLAGLFPECCNGVESTDPARWPSLPEKPALG